MGLCNADEELARALYESQLMAERAGDLSLDPGQQPQPAPYHQTAAATRAPAQHRQPAVQGSGGWQGYPGRGPPAQPEPGQLRGSRGYGGGHSGDSAPAHIRPDQSGVSHGHAGATGSATAAHAHPGQPGGSSSYGRAPAQVSSGQAGASSPGGYPAAVPWAGPDGAPSAQPQASAHGQQQRSANRGGGTGSRQATAGPAGTGDLRQYPDVYVPGRGQSASAGQAGSDLPARYPIVGLHAASEPASSASAGSVAPRSRGGTSLLQRPLPSPWQGHTVEPPPQSGGR